MLLTYIHTAVDPMPALTKCGGPLFFDFPNYQYF